MRIESSGMPLGMFGDGRFGVDKLGLGQGDPLFLYTDGISEARDRSGVEYSVARLAQFAAQQKVLSPGALAAACMKDLGVGSSLRTGFSGRITLKILAPELEVKKEEYQCAEEAATDIWQRSCVAWPA